MHLWHCDIYVCFAHGSRLIASTSEANHKNYNFFFQVGHRNSHLPLPFHLGAAHSSLPMTGDHKIPISRDSALNLGGRSAAQTGQEESGQIGLAEFHHSDPLLSNYISKRPSILLSCLCNDISTNTLQRKTGSVELSEKQTHGGSWWVVHLERAWKLPPSSHTPSPCNSSSLSFVISFLIHQYT